MAVLDAKLPAFQASTKAITPTKAEAKVLSGTAPLVIDGGGLGSGVRVLLKDQAKAEQNGLFEVTSNEAFAGTGLFAGSGNFAKGETWVLTRTTDADSSGEVTEGMLVPVEDGETNQQTSWIQRTPGPIEVGVTAQSYEALVAGARGTAGGDLEGTYSAPGIAEGVVDTAQIAANAVTSTGLASNAATSTKIAGEAVGATKLATNAKELFLQLVSTTKRQVAFGSAEITYPGGAEDSNEATVTLTGLEATPAIVLPISTGGTSGFNSWLRITAKEKGKFKIRAYNPGKPGAGSTVAFDYLAIG